MFAQLKTQAVERGNFLMFLQQRSLPSLLPCILIGLPAWYIIVYSLLFQISSALPLALMGLIPASNHVSLSRNCIWRSLRRLVSPRCKSRKKALFVFYGDHHFYSRTLFFLQQGGTTTTFYMICAGVGDDTARQRTMATVVASRWRSCQVGTILVGMSWRKKMRTVGLAAIII